MHLRSQQRLPGLGLALLAIAGCASLAQLEDATPGTAAPRDAGRASDAAQGDGSAVSDGSVPEPVSDAGVRCGTATCTLSEACCGATCVPRGQGCVVDAGPDADGGPPPVALECKTYRECSGKACCYHSSRGSYCASSCQGGEVFLCTRGVDSCGEDDDCKDLRGPPPPDSPEVGECR